MKTNRYAVGIYWSIEFIRILYIYIYTYEIVNNKNILILILYYKNNCNYYKIRIVGLYICEFLFRSKLEVLEVKEWNKSLKFQSFF